MLGYSKYWTGGVSFAQWRELLNPSRYNWVNLTLIHLDVERDRNIRNWSFEAFLLGVRAWLVVSWEQPTREVLDAVEEVSKGSV